jgi:hypothetical protein
MFTFFNKKRGLCYSADQQWLNRTNREMTAEEDSYTSAPLPKSDWSFFYLSQQIMYSFSLHPKPCDVGSLVNAWNYQAVQHIAHPISMTPASEEDVLLTNTTDQCIYLYSDSHMIAVLEGWSCVRVPHLCFYTKCEIIQPAVLVREDTPILFLRAYLYRKGNSSSGTYYIREETLVLPAGFYEDLGIMVATLNSSIAMRGERNGFIYNFEQKRGKLSIIATHRQPEPSSLEVTPLVSTIGLEEACVLQLRTNKRLVFERPVCNMVL